MSKKRSYLDVIIKGYCPKCRKDKLFINKPSFLPKKNLAMIDRCPSCRLKTEKEIGFYYGTGYISYGITVAFSLLTFFAFWIVGSFPFSDSDILIAWIVVNAILLVFIQPLLMRISRIIWLSWFS